MLLLVSEAGAFILSFLYENNLSVFNTEESDLRIVGICK